MEIRQRPELRKLLVPQLTQSLKVLTLPLHDLKNLVEEALENNPFLEEVQPKITQVRKTGSSLPLRNGLKGPDLEFRLGLITQKNSLQDVLLRQLGMFANTDEELRIGQEIIGNIDENGYLGASLEQIAQACNAALDKAECVLKLIQQFEPPGVAGRSISECLLIQLDLAGEDDPLLRKIIESHLEDVAKKNYSHISKALNEPLEKIEPYIKRILKLDPKPGRNYSLDEAQRVIPDIIIEEKDEDLEITINNEDIPSLDISKAYRQMLKDSGLNPQTREFLTQKLQHATELLRAISKRQATLRCIVEAIVEVQQDAIRQNLSFLKPITFQDIAQKINMHESTVCRAIMNKYVRLPYGVVALKNFFTSHIHSQNGESVSSSHVKGMIKELIEKEDKTHPLSDADLCKILSKEKGLNLSRRTVAKYREELKILSSTFRRVR